MLTEIEIEIAIVLIHHFVVRVKWLLPEAALNLFFHLIVTVGC